MRFDPALGVQHFEHGEADALLNAEIVLGFRALGDVSTANWACANPPTGSGCECAFDMAVTYDPTTGPGGSWYPSGTGCP